MMRKKMFLILSVICLSGFVSLSNAADFVIKDYTFTWRVAETGHVKMAIQKQRGGIDVILRSMGGRLATLFLLPSQAKAIGEVLTKAEYYYSKHKKSKDLESKDTVPVGEYQVTFSSSQGEDFEIRVNKPKIFSAAVLLTKEEALRICEYLKKAEEMAAFVDKRIEP